jgi:hypothetical protein
LLFTTSHKNHFKTKYKTNRIQGRKTLEHDEEKNAFVKLKIFKEANIQAYLWRKGTVVSEHTMSL